MTGKCKSGRGGSALQPRPRPTTGRRGARPIPSCEYLLSVAGAYAPLKSKAAADSPAHPPARVGGVSPRPSRGQKCLWHLIYPELGQSPSAGAVTPGPRGGRIWPGRVFSRCLLLSPLCRPRPGAKVSRGLGAAAVGGGRGRTEPSHGCLPR